MRKTLIAANWKMNMTVKETEKFFKDFKLASEEGKELLVCPPFTDIPLVKFFLERSSIRWGAQDVYPEERGAFTGEISPVMLKDLGCTYVIVGHSERRQIMGESDSFIARKVSAVLKEEMSPILCVGETEEERNAGKTEARIRDEVMAALKGTEAKNLEKTVIAYEPLWAIGSGKAAAPEDAENAAVLIRKTVQELAGKKAASAVRILYGGSVNADNIASFVKKKNVDGALIGGASLEPGSLLEIYHKA